MQRFHTVIVGAGPGGLACATHLARHGKDVLVLERQGRIGPKVCAGGIPSATLSLGLPEEILERSFSQQEILSNFQRTTLHSDQPIICTVDRGRLGDWMEKKALTAGVCLRKNTPVLGLDEKKVHTRSGDFGYDFLVGADGSGSMVRRHLSIPTTQCGVGINYQIQGNFPKMEWHLNSRLFGNGYAWIFPHQSTASIGAYASRKETSPAKLLNSLRQWAARQRIPPVNGPPRAALINFDYRGWRFNNRFLIGDAAGLASGLTGEGIYSAILSGEEAARTILDSRYESEPMAQLVKKHRLHNRVLNLAAGSGKLGGTCIMEALVFGLRTGFIHYHALELGLHPPKTRNTT